MFLGVHVGRVSRELKASPKAVLAHWMLLGLPCIVLGLLLNQVVPFNKQLTSPSYNLFTCGVAIVVYAALYSACDIGDIPGLMHVSRTLLAPLQWLGSNCIIFFVFSDCGGVLNWFMTSVTWGMPKSEHNLVYFWKHSVLGEWLGLSAGCEHLSFCGPVKVAHVIVQLSMWIIICYVLSCKGLFLKI